MKILTGRVLQNGLMAVFLLALLLTAIRLWPHPPLWQGLPQASVIKLCIFRLILEYPS